jgi:hypothetical protein
MGGVAGTGAVGGDKNHRSKGRVLQKLKKINKINICNRNENVGRKVTLFRTLTVSPSVGLFSK